MLLEERAEKTLSLFLPPSLLPIALPPDLCAVRQPGHREPKRRLLPSAPDVLISDHGWQPPRFGGALVPQGLTSRAGGGDRLRGGPPRAGTGCRTAGGGAAAPQPQTLLSSAAPASAGRPLRRPPEPVGRRRHGRGSRAQGRRGAGGAPAARSGTRGGAQAEGTPRQGPRAHPGPGRPRGRVS